MVVDVEQLKEIVAHDLVKLQDEIVDLSQQIHAKPELGHREYFASSLLSNYLEGRGFQVERGIADLKTAFRASYGNGKKPEIALLAEYDALPSIGHGCGHNLIGAASVGAAVLVKSLLAVGRLKGKVVVLGTPAEETSGGKVTMVEKKCFSTVDAALMFHPGDMNAIYISSLAMDAIEFTFQGRAAHAAAAPQQAINALDGVIQLFNGINALRQYVEDDVKIHGVIVDGGATPNIIPDHAVARFYVRASTRPKLDYVVNRVLECARGASLQTGAKVSWHNYELSYDEMITNNTIAKVFEKNLKAQGVDSAIPDRAGGGSIDMGNVSQLVPAIHPYLSMGIGNCSAHTSEFTKAVGTRPGNQLLLLATKVLANTVVDLLAKPDLLRQAKNELRQRR